MGLSDSTRVDGINTIRVMSVGASQGLSKGLGLNMDLRCRSIFKVVLTHLSNNQGFLIRHKITGVHS